MSLQNGSTLSIVNYLPTYDVGVSIPGKPASAALIANIDIVRQIIISASTSGGTCDTTATSDATFSVTKNGAQVFTVKYPAGVSTAVIAGSDTTFNIGDTLAITSPTQDATLANVRFTLAALKTGQ